MKSSAKNIIMTSFDDLFTAGAGGEAGGEKIREIPLEELHSFRNHPFKILEDASMEDMADSIRKHGVLVPGIVRKRPEGGYELIAGHRRRYASKLAGRTTMPAVVRELDDDDAVLAMVDSNLQRENLLPSEKAWAYKMKLDALKHQGMKSTSRQVGEKYSVNILSEDSGDSARNIHRYISLTRLLPELLEMADDKKLAFNAAVELSCLSRDEQGLLLDLKKELCVIQSLVQAGRLKKFSREGTLCWEAVTGVLRKAEGPSPVQVTLKQSRLKHFFPESYTQKQIEEVIFSLLEEWKGRGN